MEGDDDDEKIEVGLLSLSQAQFENLTNMIDDPEYPYIKSGDDLCNRVLWTQKKKSGKKKYPEVKWSVDKKATPKPEIEFPEELEDMKSIFKISEEDFKKAWDDYNSSVSGEVKKRNEERIKKSKEVEDEDEEDSLDEEYFDEDSDDDLPADDFLDDEDEDDGKDSEDDFEDDLPWEEDAEEVEERQVKKSVKSTKGKAKL